MGQGPPDNKIYCHFQLRKPKADDFLFNKLACYQNYGGGEWFGRSEGSRLGLRLQRVS